ncbi:MAG: hypothetical protein US18_C0022G0007, partial [Parcubacteria group bacterium GW2011_GWB1_36_5]
MLCLSKRQKCLNVLMKLILQVSTSVRIQRLIFLCSKEVLMESSLVFLKPDGLSFEEDILKLVCLQGFSFSKLGQVVFDEVLIRYFYPELPEHIVQKCIKYFYQKNLPVYTVSGVNAIGELMLLKSSIRQIYGAGRTGEILHSTSSVQDFQREYFIMYNCINVNRVR